MSQVYLVTNQKELFDNETYKIISVEESLRLLEPLKIIGVDTETKGLNPHTGTLLCTQLGNRDFQIVIDCSTINITSYKEFLESDRLFLFWNARFDLKWLYKKGIVPKNVYDGFLAEKLMWLGYPTVLSPEIWYKIKEPRYDFVPEKIEGKKKTKPYYIIHMNLKKAGKMYCNVELDKTVRGQIIWRGLDTQVIEYAALDVKYLEDIKIKQEQVLQEKGLMKAMDVMNRFILPLAYLEYCGIKLDVPLWKEKMKMDKEALDSVVKKRDEWLIPNDPTSKYIYINYQGDLFAENPFDTTPKVKINWNSAKQVIPIFKKFGVNVEIEDNEENKDSINEKVIAPQANKCSLIPLYLEYKGLMKLVSTYGQNVLDQLDEKSGRLYTNWNPLGTDTARVSSGGKDKEKKIKYINFLNFPADELTRRCFIAEPGNKFISIDYSG